MNDPLVARMGRLVDAVTELVAELAAADELVTVLRAECDQLEVRNQALTVENRRLQNRMAKTLAAPAERTAQ